MKQLFSYIVLLLLCVFSSCSNDDNIWKYGEKQEKYKKIADYYFLSREETAVSFAVVEIVGDEINLIENAF